MPVVCDFIAIQFNSKNRTRVASKTLIPSAEPTWSSNSIQGDCAMLRHCLH